MHSGWPFLKRQHHKSQAFDGSRPRAALFPRPSSVSTTKPARGRRPGSRQRGSSAQHRQTPAKRKIQKARSARVVVAGPGLGPCGGVAATVGAGWGAAHGKTPMEHQRRPMAGAAAPATAVLAGGAGALQRSPKDQKGPKSGMILRANGPKIDSTCVRAWGPSLAAPAPPAARAGEEKISHVPKSAHFPTGARVHARLCPRKRDEGGGVSAHSLGI